MIGFKMLAESKYVIPTCMSKICRVKQFSQYGVGCWCKIGLPIVKSASEALYLFFTKLDTNFKKITAFVNNF